MLPWRILTGHMCCRSASRWPRAPRSGWRVLAFSSWRCAGNASPRLSRACPRGHHARRVPCLMAPGRPPPPERLGASHRLGRGLPVVVPLLPLEIPRLWREGAVGHAALPGSLLSPSSWGAAPPSSLRPAPWRPWRSSRPRRRKPGLGGVRWSGLPRGRPRLRRAGSRFSPTTTSASGTWLEFGQSYQLWGADERHVSHFSLSYAPFNAWTYLFSLPTSFGPSISRSFTPTGPWSFPSGYIAFEEVYGVLFMMPVHIARIAALTWTWVNRRSGRGPGEDRPSRRRDREPTLLSLPGLLGGGLLPLHGRAHGRMDRRHVGRAHGCVHSRRGAAAPALGQGHPGGRGVLDRAPASGSPPRIPRAS